MQQTECVSMSAQELDRLTVIERVLEKRISQVEASKQLRITPRQLRRLMKRYRDHGATGLVSKRCDLLHGMGLLAASSDRARRDHEFLWESLLRFG